MEMDSDFRLMPGKLYPLGAHWDGNGINFSLVAPSAESVVLCLFDDTGEEERARLPLPVQKDGVWCGYLRGGKPGLVYAYRVSGVHSPRNGQRFNDRKVLLDPYARQVVGRYKGQDEFLDASDADTGAIALKGKVVHEPYDWGGDEPPRIPMAQTVLYELHLKGFTKRHPGVPENLRGTYAAMAEPVILDYLEKLGVTSVEILPVFAMADEARLVRAGKANYWGYNTIGFFAPENRYWSGRPGTTPVSEFRDMVKALHSRGIEVILDVVYNHTAEGNEDGPMLSFKGIDNAMYYHLRPDNPARYENWSGCGNSLNLGHPRVLQMVMDSLRYWVEEMHVDGFRFDLTPSLARDKTDYSINSAFFRAIAEDPVISRVKLIAEPWDLGPDGYQLGNFPFGWLEWNDKYRDTVRSFWLHQGPSLGEFAQRFAGSDDLFGVRERLPAASVNYVTSHDGFTLRDLVSYNHKHNEANGENNRDGTDHNLSWNCGEEGKATLQEVISRRNRLRRALLATLFFSQGTPMLVAGDEFGQTQNGNNNPYCQDNELTWLNWEETDMGLLEFVRRLIELRKTYPALRQNKWFSPDHTDFASTGTGVRWLSPTGGDKLGSSWSNKRLFSMGILIRASDSPRSCLILLNASVQSIIFRLPPGRWKVLSDSSGTFTADANLEFQVLLPGHTIMLAVP
ncbi:glycogen debranching protein GlgX [Oxalobacter paraformigenes]|uniref:Glycogen debranching enzyme GlgX n=1 Tax=Oxalobacter paraformigenes TaxID=556268 RepID=C3X4V7_9BURK|nr:glycogen debranching protein GlgX [Oxalobacter paraformigenes]EEO28243.1 glycogen debranching enzyme GlgX [Oxalobacter paraformigenes]